jgi:GxxExxY protein
MAFTRRKDLIYPELSYQILNCAFKVHNTIGGGLDEKDYQNALAVEFRKQSILIKEQQYIPLNYYDKNIRKRYCDFIVEDKIVVEIKAGSRIKYKDFKQTEGYLKVFEKKLGLLIVFGREYVTWKRVLNIL